MADAHDKLAKLLNQGQPLNHADGAVDRPFHFSDDALAQRFTEENAGNLRYTHSWGHWLFWNGQRWEIEKTLRAYDLARAVVRAASAEICDSGGSAKLSLAVASARTANALLGFARADQRHVTRAEEWDADPWLLNTPGGTVDLKTGKMRPHERNDLITKSTAVAPGGDCPMWFSFLDRVFEGNVELKGFVRRMVGYALTGSIRDQALFFLHGTGGNGKGVFLSTLQKIMGDYSCMASMQTFVDSTSERHPTDLAMLRGARAVIAQETEDGQRWAESRIKALTGGDPITARFMRQDFFTFEPSFKLIVAGNHKPSLRNVDEAVRRRFHLVPFAVTIPKSERDPNLVEKLSAEWPGILKWAIEGCLEWQRMGLSPPPAVLDATDTYLADEDAVGRFLQERCTTGDLSAIEEVQDLFSAWQEWCSSTGEYAGSMRRFSQNLEARRFARDLYPGSRRRAFRGVQLTSVQLNRWTNPAMLSPKPLKKLALKPLKPRAV